MRRPRRAHRTALPPAWNEGQGFFRILRRGRALLAPCWVLGLSTGVLAQSLPSTPLTLLDGRLVVGGSVSASVAPSDDRAYYNLTTYDASLLRMVQVNLDASLRLGDRGEVVASINGQTSVDAWNWRGYPSAVYVSVRPLAGRALAVRGGILRPAFGAFLERAYGNGNDLIGYPLAYQYATSVRADAFPASADELLRRRGLGSVARYSLGYTDRAPGLPLVDPFGWTPGLGVEASSGRFRATAALTRGGIASGRSRSSSTGWQLSSRVQARAGPALALGVSAAHGPYVERDARALLATAVANRAPRETAIGFDAEYSMGYWVVRAETILSRRTVPAFTSPYLSGPLWARWLGAEGRYKLLPGLYVAARLERLWFSRVTGSASSEAWDAAVTRAEAGGGYSVTRNLTAKVTYQWNDRDARWYPRQRLVSAQVVLWF